MSKSIRVLFTLVVIRAAPKLTKLLEKARGRGEGGGWGYGGALPHISTPFLFGSRVWILRFFCLR